MRTLELSRIAVISTTVTLAACGTDDPATPANNSADEDMRRLRDASTQDMRPAVIEDMRADAPDMRPATAIDMRPDVDMKPAPDMREPTPTCRGERPANDARKVVISLPYTADAMPSTRYEVYTLDESGQLSADNVSFEMGRATGSPILFTPDGRVGVVRQEDGSLGVFELTADGVTVLDPGYRGLAGKVDETQQRYFSTITMAPDGSAIYATNGSWRNVGGAIWRIPLDCNTGMPGLETRLAESKLPRAMHLIPGDPTHAIVAAHDILDSSARDDAHVITIDPEAETATRASSGRVFMDEDAIITAFGVTQDSNYALLGDSNLFSDVNNNRVGVIEIDADYNLTPIQTIPNVRDPAAIQTSPYNNAAIVASLEGNALEIFSYDASDAATPFAHTGKLATSTPALLPSTMVQVMRGDLLGAVLVAENISVRVVQFSPTGQVMELDFETRGEGVENIVGALGVQP